MKNLNISFIQTHLSWENKEDNLLHFDQLIKDIHSTSELIVLPEMFTTSFSMNSKQLAEKMEGTTMQKMAQWAKQKNAVITGSIIIEENNNYYNRLIWMKPDGSYQHYDKRHLFRMANEQVHYAAGQKKLIVEINGWKICPLICYDLRFPVWSRNTENYDCLIYVANWPERRNHPWKTLLMARAIENLCYVVGVNRIGSDGNGISYSGDSAVVDFKGELLSKTKAHQEATETIELSYSHLKEFRDAFPAWRDADQFQLNSPE